MVCIAVGSPAVGPVLPAISVVLSAASARRSAVLARTLKRSRLAAPSRRAVAAAAADIDALFVAGLGMAHLARPIGAAASSLHG